MTPVVDIQNLSISFGTGNPVVKGISFALLQGQTLAIVGESGSGKSVSSLAVMGLLGTTANITADRLHFQGQDLQTFDEADYLSIRGKQLSMIFQEPMTSLNPAMKCGKQVSETLQLHDRLSPAEAKSKTIEWFEKVKLPQPEAVFNKYPHELSGGQRQRVMIAMAMCTSPQLLIADEPTTALDVTVQKEILLLLEQLQKETGMAMIFITHDLGVVKEIADEVLVIYRGDVQEFGPMKDVIEHPISNYTKGLLACRPPLGEKPRRLPTVQQYLEGEKTLGDDKPHPSPPQGEGIVSGIKETSSSVQEGSWAGKKAPYNLADPRFYHLLKPIQEEQRKNPTEAESKLWNAVRGKKIGGYKIRRQHIVSHYIADFICFKPKLIIEVDGLIHQLPENKERDERRTENLNELGFTVVRFTNEQVLENIQAVEIEIKETLEKIERLLPCPPKEEGAERGNQNTSKSSSSPEGEVRRGSEPLLSIKNLHKFFPIPSKGLFQKREELEVLKGISLDVYKGETVGLVGESGCGKSTLGRSIIRLLEPEKGQIIYKGQDITRLKGSYLRKLRKEIQIIFQDPYSSLNPKQKIGEAIVEPMNVHQVLGSKPDRIEHAKELLEKVGLQADHYNRYPHEFSGGQRQRIGIARALALKPELIICDESVSALDVSVQAQVLNLLNDLKDEFGLTYIFISHDLSVVKYFSDRVAVMNAGQIVELNTSEDIYRDPQNDYTKSLLSAIPGI